MSAIKKSILIIVIILLLLLLILGAYVLYLSMNYYRIEDNKSLNIEGNSKQTVSVDKEYSVMTYNIGFGAYNREFSFFMDKGTMKDGTEVKGEYAKAENEDAVIKNTEGVISVTEELNADFNLYQEVDIDSTRSYFVDQKKMITDALLVNDNINSSFASNFHSVYLAYPFTDPIGSIESGLLTTGKYRIDSSVRRSFPVTDSFIDKFFDLDRCFVVNRIPVGKGNTEDDPHLVLINLHMSAYDKGGEIRKLQMEMLSDILKAEMEKGNWVIAGGDLNHALYGTEESFSGEQLVPEWIQPFDQESLPKGISVVKADNINEVSSVRSSDIPYTPGINYLSVIDGFLVSDNVSAAAENIESGYLYSDHNPVILKFKLND